MPCTSARMLGPVSRSFIAVLIIPLRESVASLDTLGAEPPLAAG
jgi:hypothetical protein